MSNESRCDLYIDLLMPNTVMKLGKVMSVRRTVMKLGRVVSVHGKQTQSRLLEKMHQSNGNLGKNDQI